MTLKFDRIQAGEYQINHGPKMVGYVRKANASKWLMYKATNPSVLGNPIKVGKTLKSLKEEVEQLIFGGAAPAVAEAPKAVENVSTRAVKMTPEKRALMEDMLIREKNRVLEQITSNVYEVEFDADTNIDDILSEFVEDETFSHFVENELETV
jgi:hypothetical protein